MKLVVLGDSSRVATVFSRVSKDVARFSRDRVAEAIRSVPPDGFLLLDAASVPRGSLAATIKRLSLAEGLRWSVVDPEGAIADPAYLLFMGATDYFGPCLCSSPVSRERFEAALARTSAPERNRRPAGSSRPAEKRHHAPPFPGWNALEVGKEYPFFFLFVAMGDVEAFRRKLGETRFNKLKEEFVRFVETTFAEFGGRAWMGDGQSVLVLLPTDAASRPPESSVVRACLKLHLDRHVDSYDRFKLETPICYRMAIHRGTTAWQERGKTGNVISDSVNFIHHLGMKYAKDGTLYVSDDGADIVPPAFLDLFADKGTFEGRRIVATRPFSG